MAAKFECVENLVLDQAGGTDLLRELLLSAAQAVMTEEVARHLGAASYERREERAGHRNTTKVLAKTFNYGEYFVMTIGPISGIFIAIGSVFGPLEAIPILGIPFVIFDFFMGFIAGTFMNYGLK